MALVQGIAQIGLLADLKQQPVAIGARALLVGRTSLDDGLGGFYRWDENATGADDLSFMNKLSSDVSPTGRWVRIFQKATSYPQGVLVKNGGVKTFYAGGVTNSNGDCTLNLTDDGTLSGNALFAEVWFNDSKSTVTATGPANAVTSYVKSLSSDLKTTTHGFFRANAVTVTLGLLYSPFAAVPAGIPVQFQINGA